MIEKPSRGWWNDTDAKQKPHQGLWVLCRLWFGFSFLFKQKKKINKYIKIKRVYKPWALHGLMIIFEPTVRSYCQLHVIWKTTGILYVIWNTNGPAYILCCYVFLPLFYVHHYKNNRRVNNVNTTTTTKRTVLFFSSSSFLQRMWNKRNWVIFPILWMSRCFAGGVLIPTSHDSRFSEGVWYFWLSPLVLAKAF